MKSLLTSILITTLLLSPSIASAQATQQFHPNVSIQSSGTKIGGVSFTGVGSAILGCTNIGQGIVKGITSLFSGGSSGSSAGASKLGGALGGAIGNLGGQQVPVKDAATQAKLDTANKKESCLDSIAYTLAKQALSQVTNKTLNWVNTGFGGNPFYVRNIDSFLGSIKNEQVRNYIGIADSINKGDGDAVGTSVTNKIIEMITGRPSPISIPTTPSELKYDAFTKDFTSGGWDAWYQMTQLGQNPISEVLTTAQQLGKNINQQQQATTQELAQGNGFLSQKQCVEYAQDTPDDPYAVDGTGSNSARNADGTRKCLTYETVTPGSVIASQTQTVTNSATHQLEAADELNEVLGSFFDSLLNKLFNKGLQTLGRNSGDTFGNDFSAFGGSGSNTVVGSNGQPINGTGSGVVLPYSQGGDSFDTGGFDISRPQQLAAIIKTQKDFLNQALDSQASLEKIVPNLGHLDYCLPGPHPSWISDTSASSDSLFNSMRGSGMANASTGLFVIDPYDLFDPIKNTTQTFSNKSLIMQNDPSVFGADVASLFSGWFDAYKSTIGATFSEEALTTAFVGTQSTTSGQLFAQGFVADAWNETSQLTAYTQSAVQTDTEYDTAIAQTQSTITELESIRSELLSIVGTARARHIAQEHTKGVTVNMTCLNEAYDVSNTPIVGNPRVESDATALLNELESAQTSFYNNL